MYQNKL